MRLPQKASFEVKRVPLQPTARRNFQWALRALRAKGLTLGADAVLDAGAGRKRPNMRVDGLAPTITAGGASSRRYYLTSAGDFLTIPQLFALQGFQTSWVMPEGCSIPEARQGKAIGNAMSVPVLAAVMEAAIASCNL
jgi:site-specific DNA-cytosine methylase